MASLFGATARFLFTKRLIIFPSVIIAGAGGAAGAVIFRKGIEFFRWLLFHGLLPHISFYAFGHNLGIIFLPLLGGLIIGPIMWRLAPETVSHGIPETLEPFDFTGGVIRKRVAPIKVFVSSLLLGSGGSGGREGPAARIGASVGSTLG